MVALAGCCTITTNVDYDPSASFTALHTYAWRPGPQHGPADPRIDNSLLDTRVRTAVDRELAAKGYQKATAGKADFLVGYHLVMETRTDFETVGGWYGYRVWSPPQTYSRTYDEGTLLLDVIDPKTSRLLWRGSGTSVVNYRATPKQRENKVNEAVAKILKRFPAPR